MSNSIGARLRQARELRRLTIPQVSEATKLRLHYLQALENDDYSAIPSAAQARGFLRIYAEFLELDVADLLPAVPVEPAPVAAAGTASKPVAVTPAPTNWLAGLRTRFSRPKKNKEIEAPPVSTPEAPPAESVATPPVADAVVSASSDAQTTRRRKPDSTAVKKNALS